jgi:hypothetical protein
MQNHIQLLGTMHKKEAAAKRRHYKYRIELPLHVLAAATDPTATTEYQATTTALPKDKPATSETATTTMVAPTSSTAMTVFTGVAALPRHIAATDCRTNSAVPPAAMMSAPPATPLGSWGCTNPCKGGNIFIELLQRGSANDAFAFTGEPIMERVGVCIITS